MALPKLWAIREIRIIDKGSTFPTAFTPASNAAWTTATKLRVFDVDFSALDKKSEPDKTVQTRFHGRPAVIPTLTGGVEQMALKFKMYFGGGSGTTSPNAIATVLGVVMGGIKSPTKIDDTAETGTTTTVIKATAHGQVVGQASLFGTRGDGNGGGKVGVMEVCTDADNYELFMALPGAPVNLDAIKNGHTVWVDHTDESYADLLVIGHYAGSGAADDPDILNLLGCGATCTFGGFKPGELPFVEFTFLPADWRNEPYASTRALSLTTVPSGGDPVCDRSIGMLTIADSTDSVRAEVQGGEIAIDPGMKLAPIIDPNGVNGIGGWVKVPSDNGPTLKVKRYWGDMPGLFDDFDAGTKKQVCFSLGHVAQNCVAIDMQAALLDAVPKRAEMESATAIELTFHGESGLATDESTADLRMQDAPMRIHLL
jgi:hypothetical protein